MWLECIAVVSHTAGHHFCCTISKVALCGWSLGTMQAECLVSFSLLSLCHSYTAIYIDAMEHIYEGTVHPHTRKVKVYHVMCGCFAMQMNTNHFTHCQYLCTRHIIEL